jgi:hypothetical protein
VDFLSIVASLNHVDGVYADESDLDDCGPIDPYLAATDHLPEPTTSTAPIPSPTTVPTTQPPTQIITTIPVPFPSPSNATVLRRAPVNLAPRHKLDRRLLWNTYIGEEYVNCTTGNSFTDRAHGIKRVYEYNQTVTPQCGTVVGDKEDIMLFTTDFCCKFHAFVSVCTRNVIRESIGDGVHTDSA